MDVDVIGAGALVNRLSRFDKDIYKVLQSEIRGAMDEAAKDIREDLPPGRALKGWGPWNVGTGRNMAGSYGTISNGSRSLGYQGAAAKASVKRGVRKSRTRRVGTTGIVGWAGVSNAGAAIFTLAGKRTNSDFTRALIRKHGNQYPRTLAAVYDQRVKAISRQMDAALDRARRSAGL